MMALWPWNRRRVWQDLVVDDPPPDEISERLRQLAAEWSKTSPLNAPTQMLPTVGLLTPGQEARASCASQQRSEDWA